MSRTEPDHAKLKRRLAEAEGFLLLNLPEKALAILRSQPAWPGFTFEASFLLGETLRVLGRLDEALPYLEHAERLRAGSPDLAIALGWCYKRTHRLAQAIEVLDRAVSANPSVPLLQYNLACYWSLAGYADRALQNLSAALKAQPSLRASAETEPDFDPLRAHPAFIELVNQHRAHTDESRTGQPSQDTP